MRSRDKKLNWLLIAKLLNNFGYGAGQGGVGSKWAEANAETISGLAQGIEAEKAAEEQEKEEKSGMLGKTLGTIAGIAAAPFTGGMSLAGAAALTGAASAAGNLAGQAIGGGKIKAGDVFKSAATGALSGAGGAGLGAGAGAGGAGAGTGAEVASTVGTKGAGLSGQVANSGGIAMEGAPTIAPIGMDIGAVGPVVGPKVSPIAPTSQVAAPAIDAGAKGGGYFSQLFPAASNYMRASQITNGLFGGGYVNPSGMFSSQYSDPYEETPLYAPVNGKFLRLR